MEGLDDHLALIMFIDSLRVGNLYVSLRTMPHMMYTQVLQQANQYTDTERCSFTKVDSRVISAKIS